jgi:tetratricopeptide (TPR) repeat protein
MAKKQRSGQKGAPPLPRRLIEGVYEAQEYLEENRPGEARELLEELDLKYPGKALILELLVDTYYDMKDMHGYEWACYRLLKTEHNNADAALGMAGAYMANLRPALAIGAFERFLARWPDHERSGDARETLGTLKDALREELSDLQLSETESFELARQHEEIRFFLDHRLLLRGKQMAEKLLSSHPHFAPALNNLSQIFALQGEMDRAMETARKVLEIDPENIHALSNLTRMLFVSDKLEEARSLAARLKASQAPGADIWLKKIEAFSCLGEDKEVLALYDQAKAAGGLTSSTNPLLYHLVAVSLMRSGREREARGLWKNALKIDPSFSLVQENLDDLNGPIEERNAPWAFPLIGYWIPEGWVKELAGLLSTAARHKKEGVIRSSAQRFLQKHPELIFLAPHLLEQCGADGREFVISLAMISENPELIAALREFAIGQQGSDQLRLKAVQWLSEKGLLPSGAVRLWVQGEWKDILLLDFEITQEPSSTYHSIEAQELAENAFHALQSRHGEKAQELLEQAIVLEPDSPSLLNNLGIALEIQGQVGKAHTMLREIHARFPEYFFGIIGVARLAIIDGDIDTAHRMLNDLMQRKQMHITELVALCQAQIEVWLAEKKPEAARAWMDMWEDVDPEDQRLEEFRLRIESQGGFLRILNRFSRK